MNFLKNNGNDENEEFDSLLLGLALSFGMAFGLMLFIFNYRYQTELSIFQAIWNLAKKGMLTAELFASILPGFALIFIFTKLRKEKATIGAFIGIVPFLILTFWFL